MAKLEANNSATNSSQKKFGESVVISRNVLTGFPFLLSVNPQKLTCTIVLEKLSHSRRLSGTVRICFRNIAHFLRVVFGFRNVPHSKSVLCAVFYSRGNRTLSKLEPHYRQTAPLRAAVRRACKTLV